MAIVTSAVLPLFACSLQLIDEFVWEHGSLAEASMYAAVCWTLGFVAIRHTGWVLRQALQIARIYPATSANLQAERSWYPRIVRGLGATFLFCAFIFTATIIWRILWVLNLHV